jgi:monoamine oxidase
LRLEPAGNIGHPLSWRLPDRTYRGRLPPPGAALGLGRTLAAAARLSRHLDPEAPWAGSNAARLDARTVADWLAELRVGRDATYVIDRVVSALSSAPLDRMSLLHFLWWMRLAGGPLRSLRTTFQWRIGEGAQELARRLAADAGDVAVDSPVDCIEHGRGVRVTTVDGRSFSARRAIMAVPASVLDRIAADPPFASAGEHAGLRIRPGTKLAALLPEGHVPGHNTVIGGSVLAAAWRRGRRVSGFTVSNPALPSSVLAADLAAAFGVAAGDLSHVKVCRWDEEDHIPGCEVAFGPGQITAIGPGLARSQGALLFAGAERSSWPNNMEGAVRSGERAAAEAIASL